MLTLGRKPGETIKIGPSIVVEVAAVRGNRVTLRIAAPADLPILRGELQFHNIPIGDNAAMNQGSIH